MSDLDLRDVHAMTRIEARPSPGKTCSEPTDLPDRTPLAYLPAGNPKGVILGLMWPGLLVGVVH